MVFNSLTFLIFLGVTLVIYYNLSFRPQNLFLLAASYFFYGWWDWRFLFLLIFTSAFDFVCGIALEREQRPKIRRWLLSFSMVINMGVLCTFKYFNFFTESAATALRTLGFSVSFPTLHIILPLGISFYTFLSMSYTIDVYRREMKATRDPVAFLLFVAFFPHLVAGPIVRASYLVPQCEKPRTIKAEQVTTGIWLILLGYVKKVVIADRLAAIVESGFSGRSIPPVHDASAWIFLYAFAFQIYGDFAGYSDIARGLAKIMGFELPANFRAPYLVTNPAEFWRNWHITLSTWLRDYLYIPLGGNRRGSFRTYRNLLLTMLLGGLWHGAGVAYLLWGLYQGLLLVAHRGWQLMLAALPGRTIRPIEPELPRTDARHSGGVADGPRRRWHSRFWRIVCGVAFFHVVCLGWLLFRAGNLRGELQFHAIANYCRALATPFRLSEQTGFIVPVILLGALALVLQWKCKLMEEFDRWPVRWQVGATTAALCLICGLGVFQGAQFIYFQF